MLIIVIALIMYTIFGIGLYKTIENKYTTFEVLLLFIAFWPVLLLVAAFCDSGFLQGQ